MSFSIRRIRFDRTDVDDCAHDHPDFTNWPVVYVLDSANGPQTLCAGSSSAAPTVP